MDPAISIVIFGALISALYAGYRIGYGRGQAAGYAAGFNHGKTRGRVQMTPSVRRTVPQPRKESEEPAWMD